jgi:hypothetical protein
MKTKYLLLAVVALFLAGGFWLGRAAWRVHRQLVTLDVPNAPLAAVLRKIEWQVWKNIRAEESLAEVRVTLHVKDKPMSYVLDQLAVQAWARPSTLYAVYGTKHALQALDFSLQGDGKFEATGWTRIAPTPADSDQPGQDGSVEIAWPPEQLVMESSLSARLANDLAIKNSAATADSAAEIARKVKGRCTVFLTFHKSRMGPFAGAPRHVLPDPGPNGPFVDLTPEQRVQLAREHLARSRERLGIDAK